jgi:hypothetical protein
MSTDPPTTISTLRILAWPISLVHEDVLHQRLSAICADLGYSESSTFVTAATLKSHARASYVIREALTTIGVAAVFCLAGPLEPEAMRPVVYLAIAEDDAELRRIRKEVWTQGVVPFLVVVLPSRLAICSGFEPPSVKAKLFDDYGATPGPLQQLAAVKLRSSLAWQHFDVSLKSSVDNRLVKAVDALNCTARELDPRLKERRSLVNAAIGRFLYLYVLIDRDILNEDWLATSIDEASPGAAVFARAVCCDVQQEDWTAQDALHALDRVDTRINGTVFPISKEDRALLTDPICHLIHRVLRAGASVQSAQGQQLSFLDVSYRVLRTETISAIYERFVSLEEHANKADDGVFYTPPHLADHVLDRLEDAEPLTEASRVIDPAAGSGVFLVGAYRRILERSTPEHGWSTATAAKARQILTDCIFGIEKHAQAANVCRFSLYLTLLDYVGRAPINELVSAAGESKFLPKLDRNIRCANAFTLMEEERRFTHVVGNPPWSRTSGQQDRANLKTERREDLDTIGFAEGLKKGHEPTRNRMANLFVWLALKHIAADDGVVAMILPTRSLVGRDSGPFAHALARSATPVFVGNLSHLRRKLFDGPDAAATIVVLRNRPTETSDRVAVYRPLLTSLPLGKKNDVWALFLAQADMQYMRAEDLQGGSSGWYEQTMLRTLDRRTRGALMTWTRARSRTFGDFLARSNLAFTRGGSPAETGITWREQGSRDGPKFVSIDENLLAQVRPGYRPQFAGNVILVPRSMGETFYLKTPHAYSSTFSAILPVEQNTDFENWRNHRTAMDRKAVAALIAYLDAPVLRYFAALFGSGHLADNARFEKDELALVPCPFFSVSDPAFLALGSASSVDDAILAALGAGREFVDAYREFRDFRSDFGNARIPKRSFEAAGAVIIKGYLERLSAEIGSFLPRDCPLEVQPVLTSDAFVPDVIHVKLGEASWQGDVPLPKNRFLGTSIVEVTELGEQIWIWKSPARHAWTIEQATADAQVVIREISRDTAEHRKPVA